MFRQDNDIRVPLIGLTLPDHALEGIAEVRIYTFCNKDIFEERFDETSFHLTFLLNFLKNVLMKHPFI
jgi:hypothetical protein